MGQLRLFKLDYSQERLQELVNCQLRYRQCFDSLIEFYNYIRSIWTKEAVKEVAKHHDLNLRKTVDRAKFAQIAALIELEDYQYQLEGSTELEAITAQLEDSQKQLAEVKQELTSAKETIVQLDSELKALKAGKELNGVQDSPLFKCFGSPTTRDQLISNWRKLRKVEHPDLSDYSHDVATERYVFLKRAYNLMLGKWESKYDPTLEITEEQLTKAMAARLPFPVESFWQAHFK